MDYNEYTFDKIEDYLHGKMPPEEVRAFEKEIAADAELAQLVQLHRTEQEGLEYLVEEDLLQKIKKWEAESSPPPDYLATTFVPKVGNTNWIWFTLAAVLLLVGTLYFIQHNKFTQPAPPFVTPADSTQTNTPPVFEKDSVVNIKPDRPIAENPAPNTPTEPPQTSMPEENAYLALAEAAASTIPTNLLKTEGLRNAGADKSKNDVLNAGIEAFENERYAAAIQSLQTLQEQDVPVEYTTVQEMLGYSYLKTNNYKKAAQTFQSLVNQNLVATINDPAEWYLVVSLLPDYNKNAAPINQLLDKITDPATGHDYRAAALDLRQKLKALQ